MPVSSSTVATQIVFEPDIAGYSVGSMMMKPASQSGSRRGDDQVRVHRDAAARLAQQQLAQRVVGAQRLHLLEHGRARWRQDAADDHVADLAAGVAADDRDCPARPHRARPYWTTSGSLSCAHDRRRVHLVDEPHVERYEPAASFAFGSVTVAG